MMAAKKSSAKKSPAARRVPFRDKCSSCAAMPGKKHKPECPNYECPECVKLANVIGHAESCSKFKGFRGESDRLKATVDGKDALIDKTKRQPAEPEEPKKPRRYPKFRLLDGALVALQQQFDNGDFSGDKQEKKFCSREFVDEDGTSSVCGHVSVIEKKVTLKCEHCGHKHNETTEALCLIDAINCWGGDDSSRLQTAMFES